MAGPYQTGMQIAQDAALINMASRPDRQTYGGRLHHMRVAYTLLGTEAATEILELCDLPIGARVIPGISKVTPSGDPGTALKFDIGTYGDPDAFADAIVLSAGEHALFDSVGVPAACNGDLLIGQGTLLPTTPTNANRQRVIATFDTATVLTASTKLNFDIFFTLPE